MIGMHSDRSASSWRAATARSQIEAAAKRRIEAETPPAPRARARAARRPPRHPPPASAAAASMTRGRAPPAPRRAAPVGARPPRGRGPGVHSPAMADPPRPALRAAGPHRHAFRVEGHTPEGGAQAAAADARRPPLLGLPARAARAELVIADLISTTPSREHVPYSYFRTQVTAGNVSEVTSTGSTIQGTFKQPVKPPGASGKPSTRFQTERPGAGRRRPAEAARGAGRGDQRPPDPDARRRSGNSRAQLRADPADRRNRHPHRPPRAAWGRGGGLGAFGRSRAQRYEPDATAKRVSFEDVAGIDEAEEELVEVVDFLRNPQRYTRLGATVPKGCCSPACPGRARCCSRGPWPAKLPCRSSRSRHRSSSRPSWASARAACAISQAIW